MAYQRGQKVFIKDYRLVGSSCIPVLRPAEIAEKYSDNQEVEQVIILDERFRKGGRGACSGTVLASKIVLQ